MTEDAIHMFTLKLGTLPEGMTLKNIRLEAKPVDKPQALPHNVEATDDGYVTKEELVKLVYNYYGKKATERTFTAVEHNGGSLLIERIIDAARSEEEKAEVNKALDDLLNTFMFTRHDPQTEFEDVPGTYLINDKILQKDASNYPSAVRLNSDHTGVFKGSPDVEIIWHARDGIIREEKLLTIHPVIAAHQVFVREHDRF